MARRKKKKNPGIDLLTLALLAGGGFLLYKWLGAKQQAEEAQAQLTADAVPPEQAAAAYNAANGMAGFAGVGSMGKLIIGY